ncbi:uncharacterized protein LOC114301743 [Camellia sinensis]|uniref:uncharacterized protein LOC114301743 n=1 Tax=Camellia sinensis TaxID=4442 RepID=UPI001036E8F1|nr:uncharacterized protein LOC114301743 [Camellia sinensis]
MALRIGEDESLMAYAKMYYEVFNRIPRCNQELVVVSFKNGLNDDYMLQNSLAKTFMKSMEELMARIEKYARTKEDMPGTKASKQEKRNGSLKRDRGNTNFNRQETRLRAAQTVTTVFRIPIYKVLERIRNQSYYRAPERIPDEFIGRSLGKHCAYHNEDGYLTQGCKALKAYLEDLVRQGHLKDLVNKA